MLRARKIAGRAGALLMAAALTTQLILPVGAVGTDGGTKNEYPDYYTPYMIEALEQGDSIEGDAYTHKDTLFTASMVHNNPGLEPYTSNYNDSQFLADRDIDDQVFFLYDCAQYGLLWDKYDQSQNITLTEEDWEKDKEGTKEQNDKKVFPYGSEARAWVEAKRADLMAKYDAADAAGVDVYFMMDMIVVPTHLKEMRSDIMSGKIDITTPEVQKIMDYMFEEMFTVFPTIDGIYIRYGETYTGTKYGDAAPYHTGNNPILHGETSHMALINYMGAKLFGDKRVDDAYRDVIYRTWGFDGFQNTPSTYLEISEKVEPNEHLYFCIKHSTGDFHRDVAFNQTIGIGQHQQIVEVQCAREYEGKGAYPNFLIHGVINGMEEYEWLNPDDTYQSLRDVINSAEAPQVKGVWIWPRGGGWNGPYINGVNGIRDDNPYYAQGVEPRLSNPQVDIPDGSEMWNDLNSYVVTQWAKDTSKTDKYYVKEYARQYLGMDEEDAEAFYRLCILSEHAVLLGRGTDDPNVKSKCNDTWWTRDQNINSGKLRNNVNNAVKNNLQDIVLREKAQCVAMWEEMLEIAQSFKTDAKLIDSPTVGVKDYIITTCKYGYYFFDITQQMYIAGIKKAEGDKTGVYDVEAIRGAVAEYDRLWREWQELYETAAGCPTLFEREDRANNLIGYSSNRGTDAFMKSYRETLSMDSTFQIGKGQTAKLPVRYNFSLSALSYESSDPDVAAVNGDGTVTGVAAGKCMVTVRAGEGLSASAMVVVGENSSIEDVRFENDFAEDNTASWGGTKGTITWNDGAIQVSNGNDGNGRTLSLDGPHTGKFIVSWKMKVNNTKNRAYVRLKDSTGLNLTQVEFRGGQSKNYKIIVDNGNNTLVNVTGGDYKADTWYDVKVDVDTNAHTYTVTIGSDSVSFSNFKDSAVADVSQIEVVARTSSVTISVDDVRVAVVPEVEITAQEIADAIHTARMRTDKDALLMPAVPDGYTISVKSAAPDGIVNGDGSVTLPDEATTVNVIFQVTNVEDPSDTADTVSIAVEIPAAEKDEGNTVTVKTEGQGTASAEPAKAVEGETVTLKQSAAQGWRFVEWKSDDVTVANDSFVMPGHAVTVTAVFAVEKKNITEVSSLAPITVRYGTAEADLALPESVEVTLEDNSKITLDIAQWACVDYDGNSSGEYTFSGKLTLPENVTNSNHLTAAVTVTVEEAPPKNITAVGALENVSVLAGTEAEDMIPLLPDRVEVTLDDESKATVNISSWTYDNTNDTDIGYAFNGGLELPEKITNTENLTALIIVTLVEGPAQDTDIEAVGSLAPVTVPYGTAEEDLPLPGGVEVTLEGGLTLTLPVESWSCEDYDGTKPGEYTFTAELTLAGHITNTKALKATVTVTVEEQVLDVKSVSALNAVTVPFGTAEADLALPESVEVTLADDSKTTLEISKWVCVDYDGNSSGKYTFSGKLTLPENVTNTSHLTATVTVTVEEEQPETISVTGVTLDKTGLRLYSNTTPNSARLTASVAPADATDKMVSWTSDNTAVATVDENGLVTAVGNGTAVITVTTKDGGHTARCTVTVTTYTSGGGSSSGSSGSGSNTTTKTEKNPDGSTTTTVTDKKTGTVTETTKWPDGTEKKVETRKDGAVTITVTDPDSGKVAKEVTVEKNVTITVTDPAGETVAKVKLPARIPEGETKFADVPQGHWAEKAIDTMAGLGLVKGVGENRYDMTSPMTRGSLATVLYRLSNGKAAEDIRFADVEKDGWYTAGISWAAKHGIVQGVGEDLFKPKDVISREQLAVMLCRYAKVLGMDVESSVKSLESFTDGDKTGDWAVDGVAWCVEKGILQGKGGNVLDPGAEVSRAEVAVMLQRFVELMR